MDEGANWSPPNITTTMTNTLELLVAMEGNRLERLDVPKTMKISELLAFLKKEKGAHPDALLFEEDGSDDNADLDEVNLNEEVQVRGRRKLICDRSPAVHVKVMYNGMVERLFHPGKTLKAIEVWAVKMLEVDKSREWCLRKDGPTGDLLTPKRHIGSLVVYPHFEITLYLTEQPPKIQGDA